MVDQSCRTIFYVDCPALYQIGSLPCMCMYFLVHVLYICVLQTRDTHEFEMNNGFFIDPKYLLCICMAYVIGDNLSSIETADPST